MTGNGLAKRTRAEALGIACTLLLSTIADPARADTIDDIFAKSSKSFNKTVDHSQWDKLLKRYVVAGPDGLNRVDYKAFKSAGHPVLREYIAHLEATDVTRLPRREQFAFWTNLYNAKTIDIVLEHYPVASIRDIDISGFFADGPWGKKVVNVNGIALSLDDIEHTILRRLFRDRRVHYAVNCASVGCPNLARNAYTGAMLEAQLNNGARAYVNSLRGVDIKGQSLTVSKIYSWFDEDFGDSEAGILKHLKTYADAGLAAKLKSFDHINSYAYDWSLNDVTR